MREKIKVVVLSKNSDEDLGKCNCCQWQRQHCFHSDKCFVGGKNNHGKSLKQVERQPVTTVKRE